jgi:outer membrane protein insertion porin family
MQKTLVGGYLTSTPVTVPIPIYQIITPGGDTQVVANLEYRIPIFGPLTLTPFADIGINKILFTNQLKVNSDEINSLNYQFPAAGFTDKVLIAPGTQAVRSSTGLELSVLLPIVQAPFRIYWAYNPTTVQQTLRSPLIFDPSEFHTATQVGSAISSYTPSYPDFEKHSTFRFTIGRTF